MAAFSFYTVNPGKDGTRECSSHHPCLEPLLNCLLGEEYLVFVYQRNVDDVPYSARHQFLLHRPVLVCVMLSSVPAIPHAQKAGVRGQARLLSQQKKIIIFSST